MKRIILSTFLLLSLLSAFSQWSNIGLNNLQVNDLTIYSDTIYASTNDGIYKKNVLTSDTTWINCGKQGNYITQTLVEDHETFITLVQLGLTNRTQIYKSEDAGLSFHKLTSDTSEINDYQFLDHICHPINNFDTLFFLNHQLKTFNGGISWDTIKNISHTDRFIEINPVNQSQIIIGGETGYFNAFLQISNDFGDSWNMASMNSFSNGDNVIHDLAIDESTWYAVGESVINKTNDFGENWQELLNLQNSNSIFNLYYTNIEFSPTNKSVLYVTGFNSLGSNFVTLLISVDQGANWDTTSYNSLATYQKIKSMAIKSIENNDHIYLGGRGVYLYKNSLNNINHTKYDKGLIIYPNPSEGKLFIDSKNRISNITIHDILGNEVHLKKIEENIITLEGQPKGFYFITLIVNNRVISKKIIKI